VRCGRCSQVFNAAEALLDLETGAVRRLPPEALVPRPAPPPPRPREPVFNEYRVDDHHHEAPPAPAPAPAAYQSPARRADFDSTAGADMPVVDDSASRFPAQAEREDVDVDVDVEVDVDPRAEPDDRPADKPAEKPAFVRQAERAAIWRSRPVRALLVLLGVLGVLGLVAQVLFEYRDLAAARYAGLRPALETVCGWLDCQVGAARSINDLTVESSGLVRVEKSSVYRLSVALKNRAPIEVALPALELALTDAQGQLVARRVLNTAELGVNQATLAAGRELTLQATLQAATAPVAGYTIELFYP